MKRILSGIQPSGRIHLGNYFGMIERVLQHQKNPDNQIFIFVANYHSLTSTHDPEQLRENTTNLVLDLIALGVDPYNSNLYIQSAVPEVHELSWIISTLTPFGLLQRGHSYKDKVSKGIAATHGLFSYPVLMAADIIGIQADLVPVGPDQAQHLQITRDLATKLNFQYNLDLQLPEPDLFDIAVPGIDGQKMSKSYNNTIPIFGTDKEIEKLFMRIVTDSFTIGEQKSKDSPLTNLYRLLIGEDEYLQNYINGGIGYGTMKKVLYEAFRNKFDSARQTRKAIGIGDVKHILQSSTEEARHEYSKVINKIRKAVGLISYV